MLVHGVKFRRTYKASVNDIFAQIYESGNTVVFSGMSGTEGVAFRANTNVNVGIPIQASKFVVFSSERYKENIRDMTDEEAEKINDIRVVKFDYKDKDNGTDVVGVIAEEVDKIIPQAVSYKEIAGKLVPDGVDYSKFVPYLIKENQNQNKVINEQDKRISDLENKIIELTQGISNLEDKE